MAYQSDDGVVGREMPAEADAPQENIRKRKRIPIACNACRTRKSRVSELERYKLLFFYEF